MRILRCPRTDLLAALTALVLWLSALASAQERVEPLLVVPLTGLEGGEVRQCGIRAFGGPPRTQVSVDIALERHGTTADLVMRAVNAGDAQGGSIVDIRIEAAEAQVLATGQPVSIVSGIERRRPANDEQVGSFLRDVMLRGATFVVTREGAGEQRIEIPGPLSQSVRAAYLNCAGDLYKPAE